MTVDFVSSECRMTPLLRPLLLAASAHTQCKLYAALAHAFLLIYNLHKPRRAQQTNRVGRH